MPSMSDLENTPGTTPLLPMKVSALASIVKESIAGGFPSLWIQGEVTGLSNHKNGHCYFTLRDAGSSFKAVIWASVAARIKTPPQEGAEVIVLGRLGLYPARGDLQLSVSQVMLAGSGLWQKQFDQTLQTLGAEGLLSPERQRRLPVMPRSIAVVTSASSAAWHDVVSVAHRRFPGLNILLIPATVQGALAVSSILEALECLQAICSEPSLSPIGPIDAAILTRGGGSREDLWPFNDESVARAVAKCPVPIVAAIGHETDLTICELVADLRAATPSAAAENLVPEISIWHERLDRAVESIDSLLVSRIETSRQTLAGLQSQLSQAVQVVFDKQATKLSSLSRQLDSLSPLGVLGRGYLLATNEDGEAVRSVGQAPPGAVVILQWADGVRHAQILPNP